MRNDKKVFSATSAGESSTGLDYKYKYCAISNCGICETFSIEPRMRNLTNMRRLKMKISILKPVWLYII
jgi:hypothetical protein